MALAIFLAFLLFFPISSLAQGDKFLFTGFRLDENLDLKLEGASMIVPSVIPASGMIELTSAKPNMIGHAFYQKPISMFRKESSSYPNASSFSTQFVFRMSPSSGGGGGYGLAFTLSPSPSFPGGEAGHYLGIFNSSNDNKSSNHILAVEFDTVNGFNKNSNSLGNHVGIDINSVLSVASEPAAYNLIGAHKEEVKMESGELIHAWIEYDGQTQVLNVTIYPINKGKPTNPLLSHGIDLSSVLQETMYAGFSASTGDKLSSSHNIISWSFAVDGAASEINFIQLPNPNPPSRSSNKALIVALSVVAVFSLLASFIFLLYRRTMPLDTLEDWEIDCPHRFRYKDLHAATNGFKDSNVIGAGGFGTVYKGVLPSAGCEVAVKKIKRNGNQGMREFAAEIESLGRLRHKNLVNLQGWCKKKTDLLLVYDYIPNGSLDALIFHPKPNFVLSWEKRLDIIEGIASGLLYLHEEWEQVVIHRDIKSSNVLIDEDLNARLSDFGLARLYDHGEISHTTGVVGTIGYIAPELAQTGKASASSDVFAYGILLLEVDSGRRPIGSCGSDQFILSHWVRENHQAGRLLDSVDPKLDHYVETEVELVLQLGLLCSHFKPEGRPTMRQVLRYLNSNEPLPHDAHTPDLTESERISEINLRLLQVNSSAPTMSRPLSTFGGISLGSMVYGR